LRGLWIAPRSVSVDGNSASFTLFLTRFRCFVHSGRFAVLWKHVEFNFYWVLAVRKLQRNLDGGKSLWETKAPRSFRGFSLFFLITETRGYLPDLRKLQWFRLIKFSEIREY
jgi:hypothetical protein